MNLGEVEIDDCNPELGRMLALRGELSTEREQHRERRAYGDEPEQHDAGAAVQHVRADFPVGMKALVGEKLRLRRYGLASKSGQRVASNGLYGWGTLAEMVCADGAWCLKKRRKYGWELVIESRDGRHVGWYSGRRWAPGGSITLTGGARVDLRPSLSRGWKLQVAGTRQRVADIHGYGWSRRSLTMRSIPTEIYTEAEVVVLTACAVLILWNSIKAPMTASSG